MEQETGIQSTAHIQCSSLTQFHSLLTSTGRSVLTYRCCWSRDGGGRGCPRW